MCKKIVAVSCLLIVPFLLASCATTGKASVVNQSEASVPTGKTPDVNQPEASVPKLAQPDETKSALSPSPDVNQSEASVPKFAHPDEIKSAPASSAVDIRQKEEQRLIQEFCGKYPQLQLSCPSLVIETIEFIVKTVPFVTPKQALDATGETLATLSDFASLTEAEQQTLKEQAGANAATKWFYDQYPELASIKSTAGKVFLQVASEHPNMTPKEALDTTARILLNKPSSSLPAPKERRQVNNDSFQDFMFLYYLFGRALQPPSGSSRPSFHGVYPSLSPEDIQFINGNSAISEPRRRYAPPVYVPPTQTDEGKSIPLIDSTGKIFGYAMTSHGGNASIVDTDGNVRGSGRIDGDGQRMFLYDSKGDYVGTLMVP